MPDTVLSAAKDMWAILLGIGGLIVWFVRLEARAKRNGEDVERYRQEFKEHVAAVKEQRAEDLETHRRDHSEVQNQLNSIHKDIRELLQRTAK